MTTPSRPPGRRAGIAITFVAAFGWLLLGWAVQQPVGAQAPAPPGPLGAKAAIVMDAHSGRVLFEANAREPLPPASVTKVMTLLLALEAIQDGRLGWDDMVTASARARSMGGTQIWLETGESMSVRDLLHAIAIGSANDASVAIAEHLAGSEEAFAAWMNRRAAELGAQGTHFSNASGLPPADVGMPGSTHVTTAYDLAVISRHALTVPGFLDLVSFYGPYPIRPGTRQLVELWNLNGMLRTYRGMDGIKTGMTREAGWCLAATAVRDGLRLVAVVLGSPTRDQRTADMRTLLDWGFAHFQAQGIVAKDQEVGRMAVAKGARTHVAAVAAQDLTVAVPRGRTVAAETRILWEPVPLAPVAAGQRLGRLQAWVEGELVGEVDVVAAADVPRSTAVMMIVRTVRAFVESIAGASLN